MLVIYYLDCGATPDPGMPHGCSGHIPAPSRKAEGISHGPSGYRCSQETSLLLRYAAQALSIKAGSA